ncbi:VIT1/CCC1 transporter family protein [Candidatus Woesearchaeota archaeon]|nr:VIT1/CCC1 transporter family protein [Candidatus Woesearchaeota archaeon]
MEDKLLKSVLKAQRNEITEHHVYRRLAGRTKDEHNRKILEKIAGDEMRHHKFWKSITKKTVEPNRFQLHLYYFVSVVFGLLFGLKLMEKGEGLAIDFYKKLTKKYPEVKKIVLDEQRHEKQVLDMISEQKLEYASSIVLGLNDALVELTGALAGLTLALQNSNIIAISGVIIGFAASLSMAASEYLSSKEDHEAHLGVKTPLKSALFTGTAYIITVILLVIPFFLFSNVFTALAVMLGVAIFIIAAYTIYITVAKSQRFWPRFIEMALISLTVAAISFGVGWMIRILFGIDV